MRVPADEDVHIQLALHCRQRLHIAPWDYLVAVNQAYLEVTDLDDFILRERGVIVEVTFHDVAHALGGGEIFEPLSGLPRAHVSSREHVLHLAWEKQILEFVMDIRCPLGNVEISNNQCELI